LSKPEKDVPAAQAQDALSDRHDDLKEHPRKRDGLSTSPYSHTCRATGDDTLVVRSMATWVTERGFGVFPRQPAFRLTRTADLSNEPEEQPASPDD
jgi:hypothetical protein